MKDFLEQNLNVGDSVVFIANGFPGLVEGIIVRLEDRAMVEIDYSNWKQGRPRPFGNNLFWCKSNSIYKI